MLLYTVKEAWKLTPYQILKQFKYHKEYNKHIYGEQSHEREQLDDIDKALRGF